MRVVTIGGGPAGLYFALLLKKANPAHDITVLERNARGDTFGWGVVFSDQALENFRDADDETYRQLVQHFAHWDDIDVVIGDTTVTSGGHGFSGIARRTLLDILYRRAEALGVNIRFNCNVDNLEAIEPIDGCANADLVVAADGVNSAIRLERASAFRPQLDVRPARFVWFGTTRPFDAFTFFFAENENGVFQAHCYRFEAGLSTFIVECDEESWRRAGLDCADTAETIAICEQMFARWLDGHHLMSNAAHRTSPIPTGRFAPLRSLDTLLRAGRRHTFPDDASSSANSRSYGIPNERIDIYTSRRLSSRPTCHRYRWRPRARQNDRRRAGSRRREPYADGTRCNAS